MGTCELIDLGNVLGSGTMTGAILFSGKMLGLMLHLFVDHVGQVAGGRGSQVDADLNAFTRIHRTDWAGVSQRLALTTGNLLIPLRRYVSHNILLVSSESLLLSL